MCKERGDLGWRGRNVGRFCGLRMTYRLEGWTEGRSPEEHTASSGEPEPVPPARPSGPRLLLQRLWGQSVCCTFYPAFPSPFPPPPAGVGAGIRARLALAHDAGRREEAQKALCEAAPSSFWALEPARCEWAADKGIAADRVPVIGAVASLRGTKRRRMAAT